VAAKVSTLLNVAPVKGGYVFLLVAWNDYADRVRDELNRQADAFGQDLGPSGLFVSAFPERKFRIAEQVLGKPWPPEIAQRLAEDPEPIVLIFDRDWETFDPQQHPYAVIWLSDLGNDSEAVRPLLQQLGTRTRQGDDVIGYLHDVVKRKQRADELGGADRDTRALARIASWIELKPSVFGVSIDLKAILRDIAERRH
jgi:hypothetical protein